MLRVKSLGEDIACLKDGLGLGLRGFEIGRVEGLQFGELLVAALYLKTLILNPELKAL